MFAWLQNLFGGKSAPPRVETDSSPNGVYSTLRHRALTLHREDVGLISPPIHSPVWGVLMETGYPTATATLFALVDGTTTLYLSTGTTTTAEPVYEKLRKANGRFIQAANDLIQHLSRSSTTPIPAAEQTVFYVLTDTGILTASAGKEELKTGRHPLSPLFFAGHGLLTELRLGSGASKPSFPSSPEM